MALVRTLGDPDPEVADAVGEVVKRCLPPFINIKLGSSLTDGWLGFWMPRNSAGDGDIFIATNPGYLTDIETAHHEIWHAIEPWLLPSALAVIDSMICCGQPMPDDYLSNPAERRARLYAAMARAWDEGLRLRVAPGDRAIAVMFHVYNGSAAREIAAIRSKASRPPSQFRRALNALFGCRAA